MPDADILDPDFLTGAVVPKFPNIPRLSIVVPLTGHIETFETSLVSVLQHRPVGCEIIVPHDGQYDDPFELSDEVRFVNAGTFNLMDQISAAADVALGRFVHVLADGHAACENWSDAALEMFEHADAGVVAPVVRDRVDGEIWHAGFRSGRAAACELVGDGQRELSPRSAATVDGAFLSSGFWRRDLLRALASGYRGHDIIEASLVAGAQLRASGWRCVVARESTVVCDVTVPGGEAGDYERRIAENHRRLQSIVDQFSRGGWGQSVPRFVRTLLSGYGFQSALARATAPLAGTQMARCIRSVQLARPDAAVETLRLPTTAAPQAIRRAA